MLMPSALSSCDMSRPSTRLSSSLFASPPASPPTNAHTAFDTIMNSCRALQSMLAAAPSPVSSQRSPLPTPPLANAPFPPTKMRLRPRPLNTNSERGQRTMVRKRTTPPRGANKRRRALEDDLGRDDDIDSDLDLNTTDMEELEDTRPTTPTPATPKRARIAPADLPCGLERSDYHDLHEPTEEDILKEGTGVEEEDSSEPWSLEDDRVLVELIFEKLKLSRSEWQECARRVGKSENGVERRWKTLVRNGDIGVKSRPRRGKAHNTWG